MDYTTTKEHDGTAVYLKGRLTFSDHEKFRVMLDEIEAQPTKLLVIDLQSLESLDSVGLGLLMIARDKLKDRNANLVLRNPQGQVKRIFEVSKASHLFSIQ